MLKRYLVFGGDNYYPAGGWSDFVGDFNSVEEAKDYLLKLTYSLDWHHIVDTDSKKELEDRVVWSKK